MMTLSTPNYDDKMNNVSVVLSQEELQILLFALGRTPFKGPIQKYVTTKRQLMNKLESLKTEVPTSEEPTPVILAFTSLTEELGRLTEAIQRLGELQAEKNRIESLKLPTHVEVHSPGQFVRVCGEHNTIFYDPESYANHFLGFPHE